MYLGKPPAPAWHAAARELRAQGRTYRQIGEVVGRSDAAVCRALSESPLPRKPYARKPCLAKVRKDSKLAETRRYAAEQAERTGRPVEELYAELGVPYVDRSAAWDAKRAAAAASSGG